MLFKKRLSAGLKNALDDYIRQSLAGADEAIVFEERAIDAMPAPRMAAMPKSVERKAGFAQARNAMPPMPTATPYDLDQRLQALDESFQEMLLRKIDERGMRDSVCYRRAGVDRKHFSKIRSNPQYKPKKGTAVAFCMALELSIDEARELLRKAGYALSHSSKLDIIVEYFILNRRYDIGELNLALYEYDQPII